MEKANKEKLKNNSNIKEIEKEIENKKKLPKNEEEKINKKVFENILIADAILAFLFLISLGSLNIESSIFITDLKVFSVILIIFTILLFEYSYRKENGNICIHGIEAFFLSVFMLVSIYLYSIYFKEFQFIIAMVALTFAVYYVAKSIIIYLKMKKQYFVSNNDITEIIKK